jgi:hypothetical protein
MQYWNRTTAATHVSTGTIPCWDSTLGCTLAAAALAAALAALLLLLLLLQLVALELQIVHPLHGVIDACRKNTHQHKEEAHAQTPTEAWWRMMMEEAEEDHHNHHHHQLEEEEDVEEEEKEE